MAAEEAVARHYARRGLSLRDRRWRGSGMEIDLVLQDGEGVVFVEVKKGRDHAAAAQRITPRLMARLHAAAEEYLGTMPKGLLTLARVDLAYVDALGRIELVENAVI
ncbi:YraN family protein [Hasllibacter halocynthiae]|nr:YraN family protein [Hasllibacter halocynthiae]